MFLTGLLPPSSSVIKSAFNSNFVTTKKHKLDDKNADRSVLIKDVAIYNIISLKPLNAELNPICPLLALLGAHHILHVGGLRVNGRWIKYDNEEMRG
jgi:hypothetical protein